MASSRVNENEGHNSNSPSAVFGPLIKRAKRSVFASGRTVEVEMDPYL
jgi:hypothetical protein